MPASALSVRVRLGRGCPACGETTCADPVRCLSWLMAPVWGACDGCAGSGFASEDDSSASVFCRWCAGSGLEEYSPGAAAPLGSALAARHAAYVDRLRTRVGSAPLAVVA
jgi:hypothetical protein